MVKPPGWQENHHQGGRRLSIEEQPPGRQKNDAEEQPLGLQGIVSKELNKLLFLLISTSNLNVLEFCLTIVIFNYANIHFAMWHPKSTVASKKNNINICQDCRVLTYRTECLKAPHSDDLVARACSNHCVLRVNGNVTDFPRSSP